MNVKKVVITEGSYCDSFYRVLISFDEFDNVVDIIELNSTRIGMRYLATVEKVLPNIDSCILKLNDKKDKGFIEIKKLDPNNYVLRQTTKNKVSQGDKFFVEITADKRDSKQYSCEFALDDNNDFCPFIAKYLSFIDEDVEIVSDIKEIVHELDDCREYNDSTTSLWEVYSITSILDRALNKISYLKNDGSLIIEHTEGINVIDVNTGKCNGNAEFFDTNLLAIKEAFRQIRIRNISGIIIIDLLKIKDEELKKQILDEAKKLSKADYCQVSVHGFTKLGLLEITRSRKLSPIYEIFKK